MGHTHRTSALAAGAKAYYELDLSMRSYLGLFLLAITFWQITSGGRFDLATATLSVAAAWFVSLFIAD
jgi:hypothetical protein